MLAEALPKAATRVIEQRNFNVTMASGFYCFHRGPPLHTLRSVLIRVLQETGEGSGGGPGGARFFGAAFWGGQGKGASHRMRLLRCV